MRRLTELCCKQGRVGRSRTGFLSFFHHTMFGLLVLGFLALPVSSQPTQAELPSDSPSSIPSQSSIPTADDAPPTPPTTQSRSPTLSPTATPTAEEEDVTYETIRIRLVGVTTLGQDAQDDFEDINDDWYFLYGSQQDTIGVKITESNTFFRSQDFVPDDGSGVPVNTITYTQTLSYIPFTATNEALTDAEERILFLSPFNDDSAKQDYLKRLRESSNTEFSTIATTVDPPTLPGSVVPGPSGSVVNKGQNGADDQGNTAAIVVGVLAAVLGLVVVVGILRLRRNRSRRHNSVDRRNIELATFSGGLAFEDEPGVSQAVAG